VRVTLFDVPYVPGPHVYYDATRDGKRSIVVGKEPENRMLVEFNAFYDVPAGE
jgi:hypothetical protein